MVQLAAGTNIPILNFKKAGRKPQVKISRGSTAHPLGRSQLTLLLYRCSMPLLIQMGQRDLFSQPPFVNHPLAAAKVSQLLPPELAAQAALIQSKDSKKWARERVSGWEACMEPAAHSCGFHQPCSLWHHSVTQEARQPLSPLRSITLMSRSILIQLRCRPWKNTLESWKCRWQPHVCRSSTPFPLFGLERNCERSASWKRCPPVQSSKGKTVSRPRGFPCCSLLFFYNQIPRDEVAV